MTKNGLILENVRLTLGDSDFAFDVNFPAQSITAVIGPSGAGKTTLLNLIAGFAFPNSGHIWKMGEDLSQIPPNLRPISMVFQDHNLFAHLSAAQNVALGLQNERFGQENDEAVKDALAAVGLSGKGMQFPGELSGGERQRVAIARCLLRERPILILDEPFAALGPALRQDMLKLVAKLRNERELTIIMVTHSPSDAALLADRVAYIENGQVVVCGPTADILDNHLLSNYLGNWGASNKSVVVTELNR